MTYSDDDIVNRRVEKSNQSFQEAVLLLKAKFYTGAISSLYYSAFYMVSALFKMKNIRAKSHNGIRTVFHQVFVLTSEITRQEAEIFETLFNARQEADYSDYSFFTEEEVEELLNKTSLFNQNIKSLIEKS